MSSAASKRRKKAERRFRLFVCRSLLLIRVPITSSASRGEVPTSCCGILPRCDSAAAAAARRSCRAFGRPTLHAHASSLLQAARLQPAATGVFDPASPPAPLLRGTARSSLDAYNAPSLPGCRPHPVLAPTESDPSLLTIRPDRFPTDWRRSERRSVPRVEFFPASKYLRT